MDDDGGNQAETADNTTTEDDHSDEEKNTKGTAAAHAVNVDDVVVRAGAPMQGVSLAGPAGWHGPQMPAMGAGFSWVAQSLPSGASGSFAERFHSNFTTEAPLSQLVLSRGLSRSSFRAGDHAEAQATESLGLE